MRKRCKTKQDHLDFIKEVHGDLFDYSDWIADETPFTNKTKIPIKCLIHGTFHQTLNNHKSGAGCPACYGNNPKTRDQYIATFIERYGPRYAYDSWTTDKFSAHTKIDITCPTHGIFSQSINGHLRGHGCPSCKQSKMEATNIEKYGVSNYNQSHILPESLAKLDDRSWVYAQHITLQRPLTDIAQELGVWPIAIEARLIRFNIPQMYHQHAVGRSVAEKEICQFLTDMGVEIETSNRTLIKPKELDIVIHSHKIAIEYCGLYWHSNANERMTAHYHKDKMDACNNAGYRLITIFEDEWLENRDIVKSKIAAILNKDDRARIFARKSQVVEMNTTDRDMFFSANHIQGSGPGSLTYGLLSDNKIVAAMTFIRKSNNCWILNRYATSCSVIGGFTKLLKHFERNNEWREILSFADLRWSVGNVYEACGFDLDGKVPPDYAYVIGSERIHKFNFRHSRLKVRMGDEYNPNESESQNAARAGLYKIYNCGLLRYTKKNLA